MRDNVEELELHPQTGTFPLKNPKKQQQRIRLVCVRMFRKTMGTNNGRGTLFFLVIISGS